MSKIWFRRKLYGWGWTPSTWQGWLVIAIYMVLILAFVLSVNKNSPVQEVMFMGVLPAGLLTIALLRIVYKKGEKPRWQWGKRLKD